MKFKVGDRVRLVKKYPDDPEWMVVGDEYEIDYSDDNPGFEYPYSIRIPGGFEYELVRENQLEPVATVYKLQLLPEPEGGSSDE